jgi:two-component system, chemotaxis family, sensor kinase CheA
MPEAPATDDNAAPQRPVSMLTDASKQFDLVHTTLLGMVGIVLLLYAAVLLPVFGYQPVESMLAAVVMGLAAVVGIIGLYVMNFRVHKHVTEQAQLTEALVNSLGQGFVVFDRNGRCGKVYSQACLELLQGVPADRPIDEVLRVPSASREDFYSWVDVLFDATHALGFDDAAKFLPESFPHDAGKNVNLMYRPVRSKNGALVSVVVIATDRSDEVAAQEMARQQQQFAAMICKIFQERNQFVTTITHIRDFLVLAAKPTSGRGNAAEILRQLHTLKGAVRHFNLLRFGDLVHELEDLLRIDNNISEEQFKTRLRDAHQRIEQELQRVLIEVKDIINTDEEQRGNVYQINEEKIYAFARQLDAGGVDRKIVHAYLEQIATIPVRDCFKSFERELHELALQIDKKVKPLVFTGANPRVLAQPLSEFFFSLTHVCRNIVDHGIEAPVTRLARGKDAAGTVTVHTEIKEEGGKQWMHIAISDDGAGIDPSRVRQKLSTLEPEGSWRFEDDKTIIQRIFNWGVSTRDGVNDFSGRGVGLEAVEREVKLLGGSIRVTSEIYHGACFDIKIPYSIDLVG